MNTMGKIKKCRSCNTYTLKDSCPECGEKPVGIDEIFSQKKEE